MSAKRRLLVAAVAGSAIVVGLLVQPTMTHPVAVSPAGGLSLTPQQWRLLSGSTEQALFSLGVTPAMANDAAGPPEVRDEPTGAAPGTAVGGVVAGPHITGGPANVVPGTNDACSVVLGTNVRVNQDCENASDPVLHGRSQAHNESFIAANPNKPSQIVASSNDYRRGDGGCGTYFSQDGGSTWGGGTAPNGFTVPGLSGSQRQYWQAGGDTAVAWDTGGTAYLQCMVFNRGTPVTENPDLGSAVLVFRSDNQGASFDFPGRAAVASNGQQSLTAPGLGVALNDKPLLAVDASPSSPFKDRIYVTWTQFRYDGTAPIYMVSSSDHAQTFSKPVLVSTNSPLCKVQASSTNRTLKCDSNQFSQPVVAPDGTLYVVWANYNNKVSGKDNRNQMLVARSTDGGATFTRPVKVGDFYDLPDCATYTGQNAGRACVPDKGATQNSFFRAANYPSAVVDPANPSHVIVYYGSYINAHSRESNGCAPNGLAKNGNNLFTGVTTPGACNNDIQVSQSTDAKTALTFTAAVADPRTVPSVNTDGTATDQFFQWSTILSNGTPAVMFYDRQYADDEATGASDISVVIGTTEKRVTSSSMPPPTMFSGAFLGDYYGITPAGPSTVMPIWSDTRDIGVTTCPADPRLLCQFGHAEDIFTARVS